MSNTLENVYREHHHSKRRGRFAILEKERGELFQKLIGQEKKVLDLGCRDGVITKYFIKDNDVTGNDIDSEALAEAGHSLGIKTLHFDIQDGKWPVEPNSFDVVVAGELLEHVYFPEKVIQKVSEILKPGGYFIGSVPHAFALKNRVRYLFNIKKGTPLEDAMHVNHFAWNEFKSLLAGSFKEVTLYPLGRSYGGLKSKIPALFAYAIAFKARKLS